MNNKSRIKNVYKYFTKGRYGVYEGVPCPTGFSNLHCFLKLYPRPQRVGGNTLLIFWLVAKNPFSVPRFATSSDFYILTLVVRLSKFR